MQFHQAQLDNGLQIVAELNPDVYSVAVEFLVRTGSRDETADVSGVSHFLEHMAFKGTPQHTAEDVNRIFDEIGAENNASTTQEVTEFHALLLPEHLPVAFNVLADIIYPSLRREDFDLEKNVILEEIGMYQDQPSWVAYERVMQRYFDNHPLGWSILGTTESVGGLTAEQMRDYHQRRYTAGNTVLAVTGAVAWDDVLELARRHCADWPEGRPGREHGEIVPGSGLDVVTNESGVQEQVIQLIPAPASADDLRFAAEMLTVVVGDSVGSRMFWELVDPGHVEAAELGYHDYDGAGTYMTFLSCRPEQIAENLKRMQQIFNEVNRDGVTEVELELARNKVASRIVLSGERPMGRLSSLGNNWVYRNEYRSIDDDLRTLNDITVNDVRNALDAYPLIPQAAAAVGPLESIEPPETL